MIDEGYDYYRYVDDIRIICRDKFHARKAIKMLSEELRKIDLSLNGYKTKILEYGSSGHKEFIDGEAIELDRINALINTKKRNIVAIAYQDVKNKLEKCLEDNEYDSRKFRFLIGRMAKIALCKDIKRPKNFYDKIKSNMLKAIVTHPASMDQYYDLLSSIELTKEDMEKLFEYLANEELSIYSWQNYSLWKLFILNNYKTDKLLLLAARQINIQKEASAAGAILYLGKFGDLSAREAILSLLKNTKSFFLQRHCLIALQELPYEYLQKVSEEIIESNKGVYKYFHKLRNHEYIKPPEKINFYDIFDQVGFYA
jgi:hypothetical protein